MAKGICLDGRPRRKPGTPVTIGFFLECSMPEPNSGCWIWMRAYKPGGYGTIRIDGKAISASRAAYQIANNVTLPSNIDVCHKCDNRLCVNPDHLFAGTRKDNMRDCADKGRINTPNLAGEDCPASKLTEPQVRAIRKDTRSMRALARAYGVDKGTIAHIVKRKTWRHI